MTGKIRIVIALASAFGCTAAAHAASNHQANWIAAGDEQYPPMIMFEGNNADTVATITTPDAETVGAGLSNAASVIAGERSRTTKWRIRRSTASAASLQSEWVAAGDEHYPPMVMFEGLGTDTNASTDPDAVASTTTDSLEKTSTETSASIGGTSETPSESIGAVLPLEPPTDPDRNTGTDMHSGKQDKISGRNPETPDRASNDVHSEGYVVSWTPATSSDWEAYSIKQDVENTPPASSTDVEQLIRMYDILLPPSGVSPAPEPTAVQGLRNEESPG
jgi:hypothetical protein